MNRWKNSSVTVGIACCAAILIPVVHHYQLRFDLANYITGLKAKGEPMDFAQVMPPPVPPDQNGVPFIAGSFTNLVHRNLVQTNPPPAMLMVALGRAMIGWQQPEIRSVNAANSWKDLGRELAAAKSDLESLEGLLDHPHLDFHFDYEKVFSFPLGHLVTFRRNSECLKASALYDLHQRRTSDACVKLRTVLAIVKCLTEERFVVSQEFRLGIAKDGVYATWEVLQDPAISENDLILLQQDWQALEFVKPFEHAELMNRVILIPDLERMRKNPDELWTNGISGDRMEKIWYENQWRWFWSFADEQRALQIHQALIDTTRRAEADHSYRSVLAFTRMEFFKLGIEGPQWEFKGSKIDIWPAETRWLLSEGARDLFQDLRLLLNAETDRALVITAIALKRYQLRHRQWPAKSQELIPDYIETAPIDWMDGQPLHYHPNADGTFVLYSVGEDGRDDGGNPSQEKQGQVGQTTVVSWQSPHALDRVWPQPATPEQIQKYYDGDHAGKRK